MRAAEGAVAEYPRKKLRSYGYVKLRMASGGSGKASFDGQRNQLGRRLHTQHAHHFVLVCFDRAGREVENGGDFLHPPALDDETQHIALAPRELDFVTTPLIEGGEDIFGDRGR